MLGRLQGGEDVLLGDCSQISVHLVSHFFSPPCLFSHLPTALLAHMESQHVCWVTVAYFTFYHCTCVSIKSCPFIIYFNLSQSSNTLCDNHVLHYVKIQHRPSIIYIKFTEWAGCKCSSYTCTHAICRLINGTQSYLTVIRFLLSFRSYFFLHENK